MKEWSLETRDITLRTGERYILPLTAMGSTGYAWEWTVEGAVGAVNIHIESKAAPPVAPAGGPPPGTYKAEEWAVLTAVAPGNVKIHLMLRRPWEHDKPPIEERMIEVDVSQQADR